MSTTDELLANNDRYAAAFDKGDLPMPPGKRTAVVACMDARLDPARVLGLEEGDAHVIRNAGGVLTDDAVRSLAISQNLLGTEQLASRLQEQTGETPEWSAHAFTDLDADVRDAIAKIESSPFIPRKNVRGF